MNRLQRYARTALALFYEARYHWLGIPAPRLKKTRLFWDDKAREWRSSQFQHPPTVQADNARMNAIIVDELLDSEQRRGQPFTHLLDLGCGYGERLKPVMEAYPGRQYTGLDLSPVMLASARVYLAGMPHLRLVEGDASRLPFADGCFDAAITWDTLITIPPEGMRMALAELRRVVRGPIIAIEEQGTGEWDTARWQDEHALARWFFPYDFEAEFRGAGFVIHRSQALNDMHEIRATVYVLESR